MSAATLATMMAEWQDAHRRACEAIDDDDRDRIVDEELCPVEDLIRATPAETLADIVRKARVVAGQECHDPMTDSLLADIERVLGDLA